MNRFHLQTQTKHSYLLRSPKISQQYCQYCTLRIDSSRLLIFIFLIKNEKSTLHAENQGPGEGRDKNTELSVLCSAGGDTKTESDTVLVKEGKSLSLANFGLSSQQSLIAQEIRTTQHKGGT